MKYSDDEILQALKSGHDREVLKFIYNTHFPKVNRYIKHNSGDQDAAFDIFQDSIMVFYRYVKEDKFDPKYDIGAFIFAVSKNLWLNRLRKESREVVLPEYVDFSDTGGNIMDHIITREREEAVSEVLTKLGERCEELLRYSIFYRMKNTEICEKMGFSTENAVKTRKYKCMQKLITYIEERPGLKNALQKL
ncbi:MAG: sigma-70 family RNA polymerase sigma factor [Bacteroidales bacterium]|nr:sigma-70 family RNA polymerase sigma factor [Bacteroidales bacterium]